MDGYFTSCKIYKIKKPRLRLLSTIYDETFFNYKVALSFYAEIGFISSNVRCLWRNKVLALLCAKIFRRVRV